MSPDIVLLIILAVPILAVLALRVNAVLAFLSVCLGAVLVEFVGREAIDFFGLFEPSLNGKNLELVMLILPLIVTLVFLRKTIKGVWGVVGLVPAVGTGILMALLAVPLLSPDLSAKITASANWHTMGQFQTLIIGASALVCLAFFWLQRKNFRPPAKESKKHGHH